MREVLKCLLWAFLRVKPLVRSPIPAAGLAGSPSAIVLRWVFGAAAVAGSFHGVSAASSITPSSVTATNQIQFTQRFIVNDNTTIIYGNARSYSATNLPPGLSIIETGVSKGIVTGIPTQAGSFTATIVGWSKDTPGGVFMNFQSPQHVVFTVLPGAGGPPVINGGPQPLAVHSGEAFQLNVHVQGAGPFSYQWLSNNIPMPGQTNAAFAVTNAQTSMTASYSVRVSDAGGVATSTAAMVFVAGPLALVQPAIDAANGFAIRFAGLTNRFYAVEAANGPADQWAILQANIAGSGGTNLLWDPLGTHVQHVYRVRTSD